MINLPLKGRKIVGIRTNISRQRVPKPRVSGKETVTVPLNTRVAQFHTVSVESYSLPSATGP